MAAIQFGSSQCVSPSGSRGSVRASRASSQGAPLAPRPKIPHFSRSLRAGSAEPSGPAVSRWGWPMLCVGDGPCSAGHGL
eukprot:12966255-Alexandrium_andersonii.AAC.1